VGRSAAFVYNWTQCCSHSETVEALFVTENQNEMGCGASRTTAVSHAPIHQLSESYTVISKIESQADASLLAVVHRTTGKAAVVKALPRTRGTREAFSKDGIANEVELLRRLRHPHCVSIAEVLDEGDKINIVYQLSGWNDLASVIVGKSRMEETDAAFVSAQLSSALNYMHGHGVCHRGLSPHSIVVVSSNFMSPNYLMVIISDFGSSTADANACEEVIATAVDTNPFSAPELIRTSVYGGQLYSSKVDVWSLGMVLYAMLCGSNPFYRFPPQVMQDVLAHHNAVSLLNAVPLRNRK